jgi:hypothetical protein
MEMIHKGKPVRYGPTPIEVTITEKDKQKGLARDPNGCTAARALTLEVKRCTGAEVNKTHIRLLIDDEYYEWYPTPNSIRRQIGVVDATNDGSMFDAGQYIIRPFTENMRKRLESGKAHSKREDGGPHRPDAIPRGPSHPLCGERKNKFNKKEEK